MKALNATPLLWGEPLLTLAETADVSNTTPHPDGPICCWNFCPYDRTGKMPRTLSDEKNDLESEANASRT